MAIAFTSLPRDAVPLVVVAFSEEQHVAVVCPSGIFVKRTLVKEPLALVAIQGQICTACPTQSQNSVLVVYNKSSDNEKPKVAELHATGIVIRRADCVSHVVAICANDRFVACITKDSKVAILSFSHLALLRSWCLPYGPPHQCNLDGANVLHVQWRGGMEPMTFTLDGDRVYLPSVHRFEASCLRTRTCDAFYEVKNAELMELSWY